MIAISREAAASLAHELSQLDEPHRFEASAVAGNGQRLEVQWDEVGDSCSVVVFDDGRPRISLYRERVDHRATTAGWEASGCPSGMSRSCEPRKALMFW